MKYLIPCLITVFLTTSCFHTRNADPNDPLAVPKGQIINELPVEPTAIKKFPIKIDPVSLSRTTSYIDREFRDKAKKYFHTTGHYPKANFNIGVPQIANNKTIPGPYGFSYMRQDYELSSTLILNGHDGNAIIDKEIQSQLRLKFKYNAYQRNKLQANMKTARTSIALISLYKLVTILEEDRATIDLNYKKHLKKKKKQ